MKDWLPAVLKDNEAFHLSILEYFKHSKTLILRGYFDCVASARYVTQWFVYFTSDFHLTKA